MKISLKRHSLFLTFYIIIATSCSSFKDSPKKIFKEFKETGLTPVIYTEDYQGKTIRFIASKPINNTLPTLLFIHGAPGSGGNYFKYLKDLDMDAKANLIAVDRLGYGYSDYGNAETSLENQAASIFTIINKHKLNNVVLLGWSFGVPIAAKMTYKYSQVKHSVLVAGAISPEDEKFFGIAKVVQWKLTKWMFPKALKVADKEKGTHVAELTKMLNDWGDMKTPITYYHGTKDKIVPYANMAFIKSKVNDSILKDVTVKDGTHFILKEQFPMVKKELLEILEALTN